jgi:hypothetical protein
MSKAPKPPSEDLDKFLLRMPEGLRNRIAIAAMQSGRSMNAEAVSRLEFSLQAHPHAYLIRALLDLQEKLLAGHDELAIPPDLQNEIRERALARGVSPQMFLVTLLLEGINHLDEDTELGEELSERVASLKGDGSET